MVFFSTADIAETVATAVAADDPRPIPIGAVEVTVMLKPVFASYFFSVNFAVSNTGRSIDSAPSRVALTNFPDCVMNVAAIARSREAIVNLSSNFVSTCTLVGRSTAIEIAVFPLTTKCSPNRIVFAGDIAVAFTIRFHCRVMIIDPYPTTEVLSPVMSPLVL